MSRIFILIQSIVWFPSQNNNSRKIKTKKDTNRKKVKPSMMADLMKNPTMPLDDPVSDMHF
jgi:hypothetical protein